MKLTTPLHYDDLKHCDLPVDFTERVKNVSVRYLSATQPKGVDLDNWLVLPLYKHGHDLPIDNDGSTALLLANVDSLFDLLEQWKQRMSFEKENPNVNGSKMLKQTIEEKPHRRQSSANSSNTPKARPPATKMAKMDLNVKQEPLDSSPTVPEILIEAPQVVEKPIVLEEKSSNPAPSQSKPAQPVPTVTLSLILDQMKFSDKEKHHLRKLLEAEGADERMSVESMRKAIQMAYSKFAPTKTAKAPTSIPKEDQVTPTMPAVNIPNSNAAEIGVKRKWAESKKQGTRIAQSAEDTPTSSRIASANQNMFINTTKKLMSTKPLTPVKSTLKTPIKSGDCTPITPINYKIRTPEMFTPKTPGVSRPMSSVECTPKTPAKYTPLMASGDTPTTPRTPSYDTVDTDIVLPVTPKKHKRFTVLPQPHRDRRNRSICEKESDDEREYRFKRSSTKDSSMFVGDSASNNARIQFTPSPVGSPLTIKTPVNSALILKSPIIKELSTETGNNAKEIISPVFLPAQVFSSQSMPQLIEVTKSDNQPTQSSSEEGALSASSISILSTASLESSSPNERENYGKEDPSSPNNQQAPVTDGSTQNHHQM